MARLKEVAAYPSLATVGNSKIYRGNLHRDDLESPEEEVYSPGSKGMSQLPGCYADEGEYADDFNGYEDHWDSRPSMVQPEVNLRNVISGIAAILLGKIRSSGDRHQMQLPSPSLSFLGSNDDGDTCLSSSVYMPSAPPIPDDGADFIAAYRAVLEAEPPEWLPDSCASSCIKCSSPFTALRGRHHCRLCGGIFCRACSKGRCLMPKKFRQRDPQRVCDSCYDRLDPLQGVLINSISNAMQTAKHDVMDWTCPRSWLNLPIGITMEQEIYKAACTLKEYKEGARLDPEKSIPLAVLEGASGLAILTVVKAGAMMTYKIGTGLVVARRLDGSWSAPSAILTVGLGWGAQIGGELTNYIFVLHGSETVKTFCSRLHCSLGAGFSAAAGPVGRVLEADIRTGDRGSGICYTYSSSKGAFIGVSLEGNVVFTRSDTNLRFYGDPYLSTSEILMGTVEQPKAAMPLYRALDELYAELGC